MELALVSKTLNIQIIILIHFILSIQLDVNECESEHACPKEAKCVNKIGSYTCYCGVGYQYANKTCKRKYSTR
jgi:hypothetical protein